MKRKLFILFTILLLVGMVTLYQCGGDDDAVDPGAGSGSATGSGTLTGSATGTGSGSTSTGTGTGSGTGVDCTAFDAATLSITTQPVDGSTGGTYSVAWSTFASAEAYGVDLWNVAGSTVVMQNLPTGAGTSSTLINSPGSYFFRVYAEKTGCTDKITDSNPFNVTGVDLCATFTGQTIVIGTQPANGLTGSQYSVTWTDINYADYYTVDLYDSTNALVTAGVCATVTAGTQLCNFTGNTGGTYYFKVIAKKAGCPDISVDSSQFTVTDPCATFNAATLTLTTQPVNGTGGNSFTVGWTDIASADTYDVDLYYSGGTLAQANVCTGVLNGVQTCSYTISASNTYYFVVKANKTGCTTKTANSNTFTVSGAGVDCTAWNASTLTITTQPTNTTVGSSVIIGWTDITGGENYVVDVGYMGMIIGTNFASALQGVQTISAIAPSAGTGLYLVLRAQKTGCPDLVATSSLFDVTPPVVCGLISGTNLYIECEQITQAINTSCGIAEASNYTLPINGTLVIKGNSEYLTSNDYDYISFNSGLNQGVYIYINYGNLGTPGDVDYSLYGTSCSSISSNTLTESTFPANLTIPSTGGMITVSPNNLLYMRITSYLGSVSGNWTDYTITIVGKAPNAGEACGNPHSTPLANGLNTLTKDSTYYFGIPSCFTAGTNVDWYSYQTTNGNMTFTPDAAGYLAIKNSVTGSQYYCGSSSSPVTISVPASTQLCIAVQTFGAITQLTIDDFAPGAGESCQTAEQLITSPATVTPTTRLKTLAACIPAGSNTYWTKINLSGSTQDNTIVVSSSVGTQVALLYGLCPTTTFYLVCASNTTWTSSYTYTPGSEMYILIAGTSSGAVAKNISWTTYRSVGADCSTAIDLTNGSAYTLSSTMTGGGVEETGSCRPTDTGTDIVFHYHSGATAVDHLGISATYAGANSASWFTLVVITGNCLKSSGGTELRCETFQGSSKVFKAVPFYPNTDYYIKINKWNTSSDYLTALTIKVDELASMNAGESCNSALTLTTNPQSVTPISNWASDVTSCLSPTYSQYTYWVKLDTSASASNNFIAMSSATAARMAMYYGSCPNPTLISCTTTAVSALNGFYTPGQPVYLLIQGSNAGITARNISYTSFYQAQYTVSTATTVCDSITGSGTLLPNSQGDSVTATVTAPFNFEVYGSPVTTGTVVRASSNFMFSISGSLSQYDTGSCTLPYSNDIGRITLGSNDGDTSTGTPSNQGIWSYYYGTTPNQTWIIEYRGRRYGTSYAGQGFVIQLILHEGTGDFEIKYCGNGGATDGTWTDYRIYVESMNGLFYNSVYCNGTTPIGTVTPGTTYSFNWPLN